ncbi:DUF4860 domain-containing protein [Desulfitobacterium sp. PCE1]|uniref:DUF4860 domain-containing protein n=1 Tax=Desulfitobacterium sp. PCE1 TaxID=146907 RepID=UPI00037D42D5|nr:DUF4860 domain-containing protein [Desulfitobacterium sp. PCE1]
MDYKFKWSIHNRSLDFIFILALLCVFAFGSLIAVILGANIYKGIKENMDSNFEFRTPLSYIGTKVRQSDVIDSIRIVEKEGVDALVLEQPEGGEICQTWIYEYQGSLYEVYIEKGTPFLLEEGLAIIPSYGLEFDLKGNLLDIKTKDHNGKTRGLSLSFRTSQGGGSQ